MDGEAVASACTEIANALPPACSGCSTRCGSADPNPCRNPIVIVWSRRPGRYSRVPFGLNPDTSTSSRSSGVSNENAKFERSTPLTVTFAFVSRYLGMCHLPLEDLSHHPGTNSWRTAGRDVHEPRPVRIWAVGVVEPARILELDLVPFRVEPVGVLVQIPYALPADRVAAVAEQVMQRGLLPPGVVGVPVEPPHRFE